MHRMEIIRTIDSSSQQSNRLPQAGLITVYKSTKNTDFLCLQGYTYQIDRRLIGKTKWKCRESRSNLHCRAKIYTTENVGSDQMSAYKYLDSNNIHHSHDNHDDQQKVATFVSHLRDIGRTNRTVPPSKLINQLATSMKLSDTQLGMIPRQRTLCKFVNTILFTQLHLFLFFV